MNREKVVVTDSGCVEESVSNSSSGVTIEEIAPYPPHINLELSLAPPSQQQQISLYSWQGGVCLCRHALGLHGNNHQLPCSCKKPITHPHGTPSATIQQPAPTGNDVFKFFGAGNFKFWLEILGTN